MCIGLQNIFTSKHCPLLATEIGTQAGNSEEKSSGICMAATPTSFTVPVSLQGNHALSRDFILSFFLYPICLQSQRRWSEICHFMVQNLDTVEKALRIVNRDILCLNWNEKKTFWRYIRCFGWIQLSHSRWSLLQLTEGL